MYVQSESTYRVLSFFIPSNTPMESSMAHEISLLRISLYINNEKWECKVRRKQCCRSPACSITTEHHHSDKGKEFLHLAVAESRWPRLFVITGHSLFYIENRTKSSSRPVLALSFSFAVTMTTPYLKKKKWLYYCTQQPLLICIIKHATISHSEQRLSNNLDHNKDLRLDLLLTKCTSLWGHWTLLLRGSW